MKLYRATSLDDIAKVFREKANEHKKAMNACTIRAVRDQLGGQAMAMSEAAYMLENMELVELNNPADNVQIKING